LVNLSLLELFIIIELIACLLINKVNCIHRGKITVPKIRSLLRKKNTELNCFTNCNFFFVLNFLKTKFRTAFLINAFSVKAK